MKSELDEIRSLVDEMAVLWVTQHHAELADLKAMPYKEAFEAIRTSPRFFAMILVTWTAGRWYQESLEAETAVLSEEEVEAIEDRQRRKSRYDPVAETKVQKLASEMKDGQWHLRQQVQVSPEDMDALLEGKHLPAGTWVRRGGILPWQE